MASYISRPYDDRASVARMSDLMRQSGAIQASGMQQRGMGWAGQVQRMGDLAADAFKQYGVLKEQEAEKQKAEKVAAEKERISQALRDAVDPATGRMDFEKAAKSIGQFDPLEAQKYWERADAKAVEQAEKEAKQTAEVADSLALILRASAADENAGPGALQETPRIYETVRQKLLKRGLVTEDELPEVYDANVVQAKAIEAMSAQQVLNTLFAAPNAPKRSTKVVQNKLIDDQTGEVIYEGEPEAPREERPFVVDGRLISPSGQVLYTSPDAGKGKDTGPSQSDIRRARDTRFERLKKLDAAIKAGDIDPTKRDFEAYEIEREYAFAVGDPEPPRPRVAPTDIVASEGTTRNRTMGDLFRESSQPTGSAASSPIGSGRASAAGRTGGSEVTVTLPNGKLKTFPNQAAADAFAKKYGLTFSTSK